ncbi:unnamed protein product [marine sediment metagenome]|uniref:Uncharacterized protein n=1 Tax=marine sediment metagenome TaxID=412755 RepID=X0TT75_9ZZZZ
MLAELASAGELFEAGMLVCFGISWPIDILKSLRVRRTEGKSLAFMVIVLIGYALGLTSKFFKAGWSPGRLEVVTTLYALNFIFVAIDMALYVRFSRAEQVEPG